MRTTPHSAAVALAIVLAQSSAAQSSGSQAPHKGLLPLPDFNAPSSPQLTGDWGGHRTALAERGIQVDSVYTQVLQGVVDGGKDTGWHYGGKFETIWKVDLDRMGVLPGALVNMTTESRYGRSVNEAAGVVLPINDVLFFPLTDEADEDIPIAITELRYTQFLSKRFGIFLGKFIPLGGDANEFAGGRGDSQFLSHSFLSASVTALINPYSTLGAGAVILPSERVVISTSLYSIADSSTTSGFDELDQGWVSSTSIRNQYELGGLPGGMMITAQYGFDTDFADFSGQWIDDGGSITLPLTDNTWNVFWNGWQYLEVFDESKKPIDVTNGRADRRGYGLFARTAAADRSTNPVPFVISGGIAGRGVAHRDLDSYGLGYAYGRVDEEPFVTGTILNEDSHRIELYYTLAIAPGAELTFDFQYADSIREDVDPATLLGLRLRFQL